MILDSVEFIVFFVAVLALYRITRTVRLQNGLLLVASHVFYGA